MVPVVPTMPGSPHAAALPAAGLPAEALHSLARAFGREVRARLPRLLDVVRGADADLPVTAGALGLARIDAHTLAEGCALLGDAAGARSLRHLAGLLAEATEPTEPTEPTAEGVTEARSGAKAAADQAALLLGRWLRDDLGQPDRTCSIGRLDADRPR